MMNAYNGIAFDMAELFFKWGIRIIVWKKFIVNCCLYNRKSDNCVENYFLQPYDK